MWYYFKEKFEDIKVVIQRRTCITMAKRKKVQMDGFQYTIYVRFAFAVI
jgi:hypothetical protein